MTISSIEKLDRSKMETFCLGLICTNLKRKCNVLPATMVEDYCIIRVMVAFDINIQKEKINENTYILLLCIADMNSL